MKPFLAAGVLAFALMSQSAVAQSPPKPDAMANEMQGAMPSANWLFVQTAASATVDGNTLTLKGVSPQTLMFTDRPQRMTGDAPTTKFVGYWIEGKTDFQKDPPNATLSVDVDGTAKVSVVELTDPKLEGDTLTYTIKVLGETAPTSGKAASLFIDWWHYRHVWHRHFSWHRHWHWHHW